MREPDIRLGYATCELCGGLLLSDVTLKGLKPVGLPPELPESCMLKEHSIGNECLAFTQLELAKKLLKEKAALTDD